MKSFIFLMLYTSAAWSVVDLRNANYSQTFTDLQLQGSGYDLKVERTYNSKSLFDGMFGYGWCSDWETKLDITAEGNIKLTECGAGAELFFTAREFGRKEIDATIAKIIEKIRVVKKKVDEKALKSLAADMVWDHSLRSRFANSYKVSIPVKDGTTFYANGSEVDRISLSKGVFTRTMTDGSFAKFNSDGKLINFADKNGNFLKLEYEKGVLKEVVDNNGRKLTLKHYPNKKVKSVTGPNGLNAEYEYSNLDDLAKVKNAWGNVFTFAYDETHNLTSINYPDKTSVSIKYDKKNDWVLSFVHRDQCREDYTYEFDPKEPDMHYWSTLKKTCGKEVTAQARYEFWYGTRSDGQVYLSRALTNINGAVNDISYHENFGRPISIKRDKEAVTFEYYSNGLVKAKTAGKVKLSYKYENSISKVSEVVSQKLDATGKVLATKKSVFKYDNKGNMNYAENTDGQKISMTYDLKGRVAGIIDHTKKSVKIQYEEKFGKPALVTRPGLGSITISYKTNGDLDKVVSPEGPSVALQVASTFNNYLDVMQPALQELYN
jgi:YD repeat-containing protein